jgi:hypothetical protein
MRPYGQHGRLNSSSGFLVQHQRHFLCAPGSNPGKKRGDRRVVQKVQWLADHNRNRLLVCREKEQPNDNHHHHHLHLANFSLPDGRLYSALGSNNRVPEKTLDRQR